MNPLDFLSGYKTYITGAGLICLGLSQILMLGDVATGITSIMSGIAAITARRAVDR